MYTNLREPFNVESFQTAYPIAKTYSIQSVDEVEILKTKMDQDMSREGSNVMVFLVHKAVPTVELDQILESVVKQSNLVNPDTLLILSGRNAESEHEAIINLQQLGSTQVRADPDPSTYTRINDFLVPNLLTGLLVTAFILFFVIVAVLQLFYIQTPTVFATQNIDFGKIEK